MINKRTAKISIIAIIFLTVVIACLYSFFKFETGLDKLIDNEQILNKFTQGDSLRYVSLRFLIENAADKYSKHPFFIHKPDLKTLTKEYLFKNIDLAISESSDRLARGVFTRDQFLNYILPYRLRYEEIEDWRIIGIERFGSLYDENIVIHATNINQELRKIFTYTGRSEDNRSFSNLLTEPSGACFEMSDLAAFAMRANGIPIAIDFTKWSNTRGRHQWNVLITKVENIPFMGTEADPTVENFFDHVTNRITKFAKIYRKSFKKYEDKYQTYNPKKLISDVNYIDVTKEYCPDSKNIQIELRSESEHGELYYLCVYDHNEWIPIDFAYSQKGILTFSDICPNNLFILKIKKQNNLEYILNPFVFNHLGETHFLSADLQNKRNLTLAFDDRNHEKIINSSNELGEIQIMNVQDSLIQLGKTGTLVDGDEYQLFYWDNRWIYVGRQSALEGSVLFHDVPGNALYKLENTGDSESSLNRCFTVDQEGIQNWW